MNKKTKVRIFIAILFSSIIFYFIFYKPVGSYPFYQSTVSKYSGDGVIKDLSYRFLFFPITGYLIQFEKFNLGNNYTRSFTLQNLPIGSDPTIYFAIEDPEDQYFKNIHIKKLIASMKFHLEDSTGKKVLNFNSAIKDMIWSSPIWAHDKWGYALYGLKNSIGSTSFTANNSTYKLIISYQPDTQLDNIYGFLYLRYGGSK